MRQADPEEFEHLQRLREEKPYQFQRALRKKLRQARFKQALRGHREKGTVRSPEIDRLERETHEMGQAYRKAATDEEKEALRTDLRSKLETLFDLRQKEKEKKIEQIGNRVAKLQQAMKKREDHREQIIDHRLLELTEGEVLAW
jgi:hypothetical protein